MKSSSIIQLPYERRFSSLARPRVKLSQTGVSSGSGPGGSGRFLRIRVRDHSDPSVYSSSKGSCKRDSLSKEYGLSKAGGGCERLLKICLDLQPERDFSSLRHILGERRARLKPETVDNILILRQSFNRQC